MKPIHLKSLGARVGIDAKNAGIVTLDWAGSVLRGDRAIRLAVTGLSGAGKSTLITSMIENLAALAKGANTLPRVTERLVDGEDFRLRGVHILPAVAERVPRFEFEQHRQTLTGASPEWPSRTKDLAQIVLSLDVAQTGKLHSLLKPRRITLEILDYPGEWLLDLPMLGMSFGEWSAQTLQRLKRPAIADAFRPFLEYTRAIDPSAPAAEHVIKKGWELYRAGLAAVRERARYLQPGRFICPGPAGDRLPFLWFWPISDASEPAVSGSNLKLMEQRFKAYCDEVRDTFVKPYLGEFDRQIVLVDLLGALWAGEAAFADTQEALRDIAAALKAHKFAKIAVVATKVDLLPQMKRDNLQSLLEASFEGTLRGKPGVSYHTAAAVCATRDVTIGRDGPEREAVSGVRLSDGQRIAFDSGDVPSKAPSAQFWKRPPMVPPVFVPSKADRGIGHRNLDEVLLAVMGDLL